MARPNGYRPKYETVPYIPAPPPLTRRERQYSDAAWYALYLREIEGASNDAIILEIARLFPEVDLGQRPTTR